MSPAFSTRSSGPAWILAGLLWAAHGVALLLWQPNYWRPTTVIDYASIVSYSLAFFATAWALIALYLRLRRSGHANAAFTLFVCVGAAGAIVAGIGNFAEDWLRIETMGLAAYVPGLLLSMLGWLGTAFSLLFTRRVSRWWGVVLLVGTLGLFVPDNGGEIALALAWIALGLGIAFENTSMSSARLLPTEGH